MTASTSSRTRARAGNIEGGSDVVGGDDAASRRLVALAPRDGPDVEVGAHRPGGVHPSEDCHEVRQHRLVGELFRGHATAVDEAGDDAVSRIVNEDDLRSDADGSGEPIDLDLVAAVDAEQLGVGAGQTLLRSLVAEVIGVIDPHGQSLNRPDSTGPEPCADLGDNDPLRPRMPTDRAAARPPLKGRRRRVYRRHLKWDV